ncbi:hypothetical protein AGR4C_Cc80098 [Agrobacterium tumefaciens str. Kerr 14]|uniref:Uncharacterized protein n=1 Tax=Agrobacterium tumefaciens str. Kerr 14 TaxID=1183424 RepID=A0A1S7QHG1_AGRTU|nr:hypothetical protein AGR4C_Cc80098 [Agrobacterium tumefaciens str. Kerr 14]
MKRPESSIGIVKKRGVQTARRSGFEETFQEKEMARVTGLEPATSGVTGRHSNRLSYTRAPQTFICVFSEEQDGASDGARTRDLRRDRPAL